jgi:HEAT repeat protein
MKRILLVVTLVLLCGCARQQPKMAGAKWAAALHDRDAKVRKKAAFTLGNIGPSDPSVLPALIEALRDADTDVRFEAILALVKYGSGAREAVPALDELQRHDRDAKIRDAAAKALAKIEKILERNP